jgi:cystathionine beta-lyase/cystathionine gamma-synthase
MPKSKEKSHNMYKFIDADKEDTLAEKIENTRRVFFEVPASLPIWNLNVVQLKEIADRVKRGTLGLSYVTSYASQCSIT